MVKQIFPQHLKLSLKHECSELKHLFSLRHITHTHIHTQNVLLILSSEGEGIYLLYSLTHDTHKHSHPLFMFWLKYLSEYVSLLNGVSVSATLCCSSYNFQVFNQIIWWSLLITLQTFYYSQNFFVAVDTVTAVPS